MCLWLLFGLYEKIIDSLLNFFKDIKKNITFLFPLVFGSLIGVFIFGNILQFVFNKYFGLTSFFFMGLILGSLPMVIKQTGISKISVLHILCTATTFSFSLYLTVFGKANLGFQMGNTCMETLILSGILMSAGVVIPGVSKTVILMMLGIYPQYLSAISSLNFSFLIPIGIGLVIGGMCFLVLLQFLFKYLKSYTYFVIIGFVIGSVFIMYPGFSFDLEGALSVIMSIIGFFVAKKISA